VLKADDAGAGAADGVLLVIVAQAVGVAKIKLDARVADVLQELHGRGGVVVTEQIRDDADLHGVLLCSRACFGRARAG